jgi:hypothetical protein
MDLRKQRDGSIVAVERQGQWKSGTNPAVEHRGARQRESTSWLAHRFPPSVLATRLFWSTQGAEIAAIRR